MLDVARFYGMVLVYYGHIIERIMYLENATAALHYKFIYSFHMPFFFLLAGFVHNPAKASLPVGRFLKRLAASRLVPYVFFSLLLALSTLFFVGHFVAVDLSTSAGYLKGAVATALGFPVFNIPLWFLACLISVEVMHRTAARLTRSDAGLWATAAVCYLGGYYLNLEKAFLLDGWTFWFLNEVPVVYAFYLVGVFLRRRELLLGPAQRPAVLAGAAACLLAVGLTFNLNEGPFRLFDAVVIVLSGHGNVFLFPFTALAGSLGLLLLAKSVGESRWMAWLGQNSLILFCLNGVFYHYLNGPFADWFITRLPGSAWSVFAAGAAFTVLSMAACLPSIWLFNRYLPQLAGRPAVSGPILKPFVSVPSS